MPDKLDQFISSLELSREQREKLEQAIAERDSTLEGAQRSILAEDEATVNLMVGDDSDVVIPRADPNQQAPEFSVTTERYSQKGMLGRGGMGEVRLVRDRDLGRKVAMKVIRADRVLVPGVLSRFVREAQASAQLEHPGIVPIYDIGRLEDGRIYFTTQVVTGKTLSELIDEVHRSSDESEWRTGPTGWTLRRLVDALHAVCETMAYCHSKRAIHRDLKPDNVMLGEFGEVLVMDWGLVKLLGRRSPADPDDTLGDDEFGAFASGEETQAGVISGTPAYMPPEQARGEIDLIGTWTDVYALGAILYKILTGQAPYTGRNMLTILRKVDAGPPPLPSEVSSRPIPQQLELICTRAMGREPEDRYADAGELARDLGVFLEGARATEQAIAEVERAEVVRKQAMDLERASLQATREAERLASFIESHEESDEKEEVWELEDEAVAHKEDAEGRWLLYEQALRTALNHDPELAEAHLRLADHFRTRHEDAEERGDRKESKRFEVLLRQHDRGKHANYLEGKGRLSLEVDAEDVNVSLHSFTDRKRRRTAVPVGDLGTAPLDVGLPMGSYLLTISAPGRVTVNYPVQIGRLKHWHGRPPRRDKTRPIHLPRKEEIGPHDVYVPAGWFWHGGDPDAVESHPRQRTWLDGFVMRRFPVTNAQYLSFLNSLVKAGETKLALRVAPRESRGAQEGPLLWQRTRTGGFALPQDPILWRADQPVVMVSWFAATAYADWYARKTQQEWRLPVEMEWEKAARGADDRRYPMGDFLDPAWACTRGSHRGTPSPVSVNSFPQDESVYGVRGMAGNVEDWCADRFTYRAMEGDETRVNVMQHDSFGTRGASEQRVARGGSWKGNRRVARCASRNAYDGNTMSPDGRVPVVSDARSVRGLELSAVSNQQSAEASNGRVRFDAPRWHPRSRQAPRYTRRRGWNRNVGHASQLTADG